MGNDFQHNNCYLTQNISFVEAKTSFRFTPIKDRGRHLLLTDHYSKFIKSEDQKNIKKKPKKHKSFFHLKENIETSAIMIRRRNTDKKIMDN